MTKETKYTFSKIILFVSLVLFVVTLLFFIWQQIINVELLRNGTPAVATMIHRDGANAYYDIEYDGVYYTGSIQLSKSAMRRFLPGERVEALVLPEKIEYDKEHTFLRHHMVFLRPLPPSQQDITKERERIDSMYNCIGRP